ncbi:phage tail assembly protein [Providencia rettgeri]|uniref:Phage tail assembly protein n=1 Tax=Providencia rettgeri TaxID=587 RepID=A0A939SR63_PRORE|nr:phage tail assembly protein [Providencia rettgeri]
MESNDGKTRYETITLKEPVLIQVEQFYAEQAKSSSSLPAMRLLIVLISGILIVKLRKCLLQIFNHCKDYLMSFWLSVF